MPKWCTRLASRTMIGWRRIRAINLIAASRIFIMNEYMMNREQWINLRQSPHSRRFFVTWIGDGTDFWMKLNAMANLSLWVERTDSMVSPGLSERVIHRRSNLCPCSTISFMRRLTSWWISSLRKWNQSFALKTYQRHMFPSFSSPICRLLRFDCLCMSTIDRFAASRDYFELFF